MQEIKNKSWNGKRKRNNNRKKRAKKSAIFERKKIECSPRKKRKKKVGTNIYLLCKFRMFFLVMKVGDIVVIRNIYGGASEYILGEIVSDVIWKGNDFHHVRKKKGKKQKKEKEAVRRKRKEKE